MKVVDGTFHTGPDFGMVLTVIVEIPVEELTGGEYTDESAMKFGHAMIKALNQSAENFSVRT